MAPSFSAFTDELQKIAANVPVIHGTSGEWDVLKPAVSQTILKNDPNPPAVHVSMNNSAKLPQIENFAHQAVAKRGGTPVVAHAKVDTKKGWLPTALTPKGKLTIGSIEDAHALIDELDSGATGARRGEIWKLLQQGTGMWRNNDAATTLKPAFYKAVKAV
jgi:hypothetical protein